ncbi:MAG: sigma 54-interacting transcriptional regulator [Myxococcaceae bacterium]|nr:sigma 54-interacting transcriptional regulator [Myxococcaceae bacterium]MCA3012282.1 sigma 54-interacting transcriptional regulator [Myxococcaceae bacterium]
MRFRLEGGDVVGVVEPGRPRLLLGQSRTCDVVVPAPLVSRRHAAVEVRDGARWVRDLASSNRTRVDGLRIGVALPSGRERLSLVQSVFDVVREEGDASAVVPVTTRFGRALGQSEATRRVFQQAQRLARADVPVLIEGETGAGKELLAESLHEASPRAAGPFVALDCSTAPAELLESTLFGHERGAFTGAAQQHVGVFERAHAGTLFIDEIGDLELAAQSRLLRVLERGEVQRVGGQRPVSVDVRVIAVTSRRRSRWGASGTTASIVSPSPASSCRPSGSGPVPSSCSRAPSGSTSAARRPCRQPGWPAPSPPRAGAAQRPRAPGHPRRRRPGAPRGRARDRRRHRAHRHARPALRRREQVQAEFGRGGRLPARRAGWGAGPGRSPLHREGREGTATGRTHRAAAGDDPPALSAAPVGRWHRRARRRLAHARVTAGAGAPLTGRRATAPRARRGSPAPRDRSASG